MMSDPASGTYVLACEGQVHFGLALAQNDLHPFVRHDDLHVLLLDRLRFEFKLKKNKEIQVYFRDGAPATSIERNSSPEASTNERCSRLGRPFNGS